MDRNESPAPAVGGEERSDEATSAGAGLYSPAPDTEVVAKPKRRRFTAEYRLRILDEIDRCTEPGEAGCVLRREGLYSSHLANWRRAQREGALQGLSPKKRGAKPRARNPLQPRVEELESKIVRLERELHQARTIMDVQEKVAGLLGFNLDDGKDC